MKGTHSNNRCWLLFAAWLAGGTAFADTIAITGATLYPVTAKPIENGTLLVSNGKIAEVGPASEVDIPADARRVDGTGLTIMPGIVDTHSHLGVVDDANESSAPVNPQLRILDSFWPADPRIKVARAGGITTANIMPGSGAVFGGQTIYIKLRGESVEEMLVPGSLGGMKMANGENPKGRGKRATEAPVTRMATAALARQKFYDAIDYRSKREQATQEEKADAPGYDIGLEALLEVLDRKRVVHHHTHRSDDIMTVLRLQDEFGFRLVLQHAVESYKVAAQLAERDDIELSYLVLDSPGGKHEAFDVRLEGAARLEAAGLEIALHSDDWIVDSRFLLRSAALAVRGGMSRTAALRALTINPARMLDLEDRIGSLAPGKDADFLVLNGDPFSIFTQVQQTWIDGELLYQRSDPMQKLYATGGFGVSERYPQIEEAAQ